ncbi:MAG TPA: DUF177 domain-containing protein [Candidatus Binatia bacterium]|jgi:uncharacterized protein
MKIAVTQIADTPKNLTFSEGTEELNQLYSGDVSDFRFPSTLEIRVAYHRSGTDLFFQGSIAGTIEGHCSRCLKGYTFPLDKRFDFVLVPDTRSAKSKELNQEDMGLSFYSEEEINLSPLIREQVLLALPTRPLCDENCRGLCPGCGIDLNQASCQCSSAKGDPRMAFFRDIKLQQ